MSRFVSAGTDEAPTERDEAWLRAQEQIEATRRSKSELGKQEDGKSLYETLQANKAAKQDAFEESIRLRNQFRSLDEDEVEFLDSVLESTRAKEAALKKETAVELDGFRKQQEEAERAAKGAASPEAPEGASETSWAVGKKRKKGRGDILGGAKLRKSSTGEKIAGALDKTASTSSTPQVSEAELPSAPSLERSLSAVPSKASGEATSTNERSSTPPSSAPAPTLGLGLDTYSSEDED